METVVLCLMIVVSLSFLFKLTLCGTRQLLLTTAAAAFFVGLTWPLAVEQSKTQIAAWLSDTDLMRDTSVLLSIDVVLLLSYCWLAAEPPSTQTMRTRRLFRCLACYPGLLIFPVLFSTLVFFIFSLPGVSFSLTAWGLAVSLSAAVPLLVRGIRWLVPEAELRLELLFIAAVLTAFLGIVTTVNGQTAVRGTSDTDVLPLLAVILLTLTGVGIGFVTWHIKQRKSSHS